MGRRTTETTLTPQHTLGRRMTLPASLEQLDGLKRNGAGWTARCPVHDDHNPSLSITVTDDGTVLAHCHAGCDQTTVAQALELHTTDRPQGEWTPRGEAIAVYHYVDENGAPLFDVLRTADKQFPQRRPDPTAKTGWRWNLEGTRRVLYRLPDVIAAVNEGRTVYVVEGEKDAEALRATGKTATCNPGGAGKWRPEYAAFLIDANVMIFADKDEPGQQHARTVAASLTDVAQAVWVLEAADPHKDIAAHLAAGLTLDQAVITHRPDVPVKPDLAPDVYDLLNEPVPDYDWLIPGLLERGERFMLTGWEGLGKSMWLRMLAVCAAAGINPITFAPFRPLKVLVVDCENSDRQNRRAYGPIVGQANATGVLPRGNLRIIRRVDGIDLATEGHSAWLAERVAAHKPDVLVIGPLYKLHTDSPNDETTARKIVGALDLARAQGDCAVMIEAHAGHGEWGKNRSVRPTGSSLYLRWPEFGYGLRPVDNQSDDARPNCVELVPWRGPRDERQWPHLLEHGSLQNVAWPWVPAVPMNEWRAS